jgi:hypothetical protein
MATRKANGLTFAKMGTGKGSKPASGPEKVTYWSFSVYNAYKECPFTVKMSVLKKIKSPGSIHMDRGNDAHKLCEDYIKGTITLAQLKTGAKNLALKPLGALDDVLPELTRLRKLYAQRNKLAARAMQPTVEETWAFTKDWAITYVKDWNNCALRVKLDVGEFFEEKGRIIYVPTDWKTGRFYEEKNDEYIEQLELYALAVLVVYPHVDEVRPRLVYLDEGIVFPDPKTPLAFTRDDLGPLKKLWEKRTRPLLNDTKLAPRPGNYCRRCFYRSSNAAEGGGQCKY